VILINTVLLKMRPLVTILAFLFYLNSCYAQEPKIVIGEIAEWQKPVIDKVAFSAEAKSIDELLGKKIDHPNKSWNGFIIFSCIAKGNLGKRLLWIDVEVTFSNGYKRKFTGISFHILTKGTEHDIMKIPFDTKEAVSVASMAVTSVTIK